MVIEDQETILDRDNIDKKVVKKPDYLEMTIQSCILPLDMRFSQINGCYSKRPIAYRTFTYINSVIEGVIPPERYLYAADETDKGKDLSVWNITEAIKSVKEFEAAGRKIDFITARVSPQIVRELDFYGFVKDILDKYSFDTPEKLCFEFPRTVLYEDREQTRMALLSMKLLKVKSMMAGCGEKDNPVTMLLSLPFDFVVLAPWITTLSDERSKQSSVESLIAFLHSTGCKVVADGVKNDEQIRVFNRSDCYGYIPSSAYTGTVKHGKLRMPLDEAKLQREEDEM